MPYSHITIFRTIRMVYAAQAGMLMIFGLVVYFLLNFQYLGAPDYALAPLFQIILMVTVPVSLASGFFLFSVWIKKIDTRLPLTEKLKTYFTYVLIRSAILEVPGLFCCVAALVTADFLFLVTVPIILLVFLLLRPTLHMVADDLQLSAQERKELDV